MRRRSTPLRASWSTPAAPTAGRGRRADGDAGAWPAERPPGPAVDSYGSGDAFAAGLTYGLGAGLPPGEAAALGARQGALCLTGRGPYEAIDR